MTHSVPDLALARPARATVVARSEEGAAADAGVAAMGPLWLAWQAVLDRRVPASECGALTPAPSRTEAAVRGALEAPCDATHATPLSLLQPAAPVALQAEFRTAPGEQWQLGVQREAGTSSFDLSLRAAFVPPAFAATQLPRLHARLRQQGQGVDRLEWRDDPREREGAE